MGLGSVQCNASMNYLKSGEPRREAGTGNKQGFQRLAHRGYIGHNIGVI